jgi:hypothetical protein
LKHFINSYRVETERFSAPGMTQPVVVLFDNDSGAKPIQAVVKDITKQQVTPPFLREEPLRDADNTSDRRKRVQDR